MYQKDQNEIDTLTKQLFEAICFEEGKSPNIGKIEDLFVKGGILVDNNPPSKTFSVDEFISFFTTQASEGTLRSLHETEVEASTTFYGNIAHRVSYYEARFAESDPSPFSSGVNSIQFVKKGDRWLISSMAWNETD